MRQRLSSYLRVLDRGSGVTADGNGSSSEAERDTNLAGTLTKAAHASRVIRIPLPIEGYSPRSGQLGRVTFLDRLGRS